MTQKSNDEKPVPKICQLCGQETKMNFGWTETIICHGCMQTEKGQTLGGKNLIKKNSKPTLLECPDCGKDVSRRATACLNCGCPIEAVIADQCKTDNQIKEELIIERTERDGPKCPHCGSTNYQKISFANKAGAAVLWGPFAIVHAGKTFKCQNCGFKW